MKLRHYYHIYADGQWERIVAEHVEALHAGGLVGNLESVHIGFVGSPGNRARAIGKVNELMGKVPWHNRVEADQGWEQETQDVLYDDAAKADEPFYALYAHTKGAWAIKEINDVWRKAMTRFVVKDWRQPIRYLDEGYGAAGILWAPFNNGRDLGITEGTQYFAGTYWWAKSQAIAAIGRPDRSSRYDAESWIGLITKLPQPYPIKNMLNVPITVPTLLPFAW